jgi:hypothetical protein
MFVGVVSPLLTLAKNSHKHFDASKGVIVENPAITLWL